MPRKWCLNDRAVMATLLARIRVLADGGCRAQDLRSTSLVRRTRRLFSRPPVAVTPIPSGLVPTSTLPLELLIVEDNPGDVRLIDELLRQVPRPAFRLTHATTLQDALRLLDRSRFDAVLLDLVLSDAQGLEGIEPVGHVAVDVPIVVLSGLADEALAVQALAQGAQDYLVKGRGDGNLIVRAILYAIERKHSEQAIRHLANHDALTGLPNRRLLTDRIHQALAHSRRSGLVMAIVLLDLDNFKQVNDSFGHPVGDRLLLAVAQCLRSCIRESDTAARIGGDEFALVLADVESTEGVTAFLKKLHAALQAPFLLDGHELYVTASIGVSSYPKDGQTVPVLLGCADVAMYRSKEAGRDTWRSYSPAIQSTSVKQPAIGSHLPRAMERGEFVVHYQPQVELKTGCVTGVEALLRWCHPQLGLLPPARFLRAAQQAGLMKQIGRWVLGQACAQTRAWRAAGHSALRVAVRLSARQLLEEDVLEAVLQILGESGLESRYLELELTEAGFVKNAETLVSVLSGLRSEGVRISLSGFGVRHSSLSYLKRLPVDSLKIGRTFVRGIGEDLVNAAIVRAVISMAHGMGLDVIAEGVERAGEFAFLRAEGCDRFQGGYFSRPLPPLVLSEMLLRQPRWT